MLPYGHTEERAYVTLNQASVLDALLKSGVGVPTGVREVSRAVLTPKYQLFGTFGPAHKLIFLGIIQVIEFDRQGFPDLICLNPSWEMSARSFVEKAAKYKVQYHADREARLKREAAEIDLF
jgi:hypothetical protein